MGLLELYKAFSEDNHPLAEQARTVLFQRHWFTVNAEFDPKTGAALPQSLSAFLKKIADPDTQKIHYDRLWRIADHSRDSIERLFRGLNESPRREQALLPIHAVRELDVNSFIKISNRPGRNIREKLAGKPYLQAVRRYQSIDLPENRLLKAFAIRLSELLEFRLDYLAQEDVLLPKIQSWLRTDEANAIGQWNNLPPNNTLLSHRDYRRIWDAWRALQRLDEDIEVDASQIELRNQTLNDWNKYEKMWLTGQFHFAEIPVFFDYEKFEIKLWIDKPIYQETSRKLLRNFDNKEIAVPVCIDFTALRPNYAISETQQSLFQAFIWQQWKRENEVVNIELFNSDALYCHTDTSTIYLSNLLFSSSHNSELLDSAARVFSTKLREIFKNNALLWLIPDFLNDFEIEIIRRNLNARFSESEPLPRSVAAIFEKIDYSKINKEDYAVIVIDRIGRKTCVTKLVAKFDVELKKSCSETKGFYWERCPPIVIDSQISKERIDFITVDKEEKWHDASPPIKHQPIDTSTLKRDDRIGNFAFVINLTESPVVGGIRLHSLQNRAGDIPLWRDQVPELSIKAWVDGRYQLFCLVSRGTAVMPIRGKSVPITIERGFPLPAGRLDYKFPLYIGENADDLGFSARLDSPVFPLKEDTVCKLNLSFEYGADEPYKLIFEPLNKSFPAIHTTWKRTEEIIITDAPAPEYPTPNTWADLQSIPKPNSNETSDFLDWALRAIDGLDRTLFIIPKQRKPRSKGIITSHWRTDKNGKHFAFSICDGKDVHIHENSFIKGINFENFTNGHAISFELEERDKGKFSARNIADTDYIEPIQEKKLKPFDDNANEVLKNIHTRLYVPIIQTWRDGRSINDTSCPATFKNDITSRIQYIANLWKTDELPKPIQLRMEFLLACMHKDVPNEFGLYLNDLIQNADDIKDKRTIGFALGDVSMEWQKEILSKLASNPTNDALRVFSHAIWREQSFVEKFSFSELQAILNTLSNMIMPTKNSSDERIKNVIEPLELLLGLLRTRHSTNTEIKMLLQPHQEISKKLAKQVERIAEIFTQTNIRFFSRVQIKLEKPESDQTPDLLYALRLYLTGDDGANAIHVTSIKQDGAE